MIALIIPAHQPSPGLVDLVAQIVRGDVFGAVIVVDDGSGEHHAPVFSALKAFGTVDVLTHAVNLGKGAALKTAFNHALSRHPDLRGVVTADADGQHHIDDITHIGRLLAGDQGHLLLGARKFGPGIPWRSRMGNVMTRLIFRLLVGRRLSDTQTGLRGLPAHLLPALLPLPSQRFEFEMDMLLVAARFRIPFREVPIQTIYIDNNRQSHFNPFFDSFRIYFLLVRFILASLVSTMLDLLVHTLVFSLTGSIANAHLAGRALALPVNFIVVSRYVFRATTGWGLHLTRFAIWSAVLGATSYALQILVQQTGDIQPIEAKLLIETMLFAVNFLVQRDVIFVSTAPRD